jgi:hypothetical protein
MNASLARRIRNAEAVLISALDRQTNDQRDSGRQYGRPQPTVIMSGRLVLKEDLAGPHVHTQPRSIDRVSIG